MTTHKCQHCAYASFAGCIGLAPIGKAETCSFDYVPLSGYMNRSDLTEKDIPYPNLTKKAQPNG